MVSFRKSILALAVLALFVGLASAQVGVPTGGAPGSSLGQQLTCSANVAVPPQLRAEGVTELIGDIVITCSGGVFPVANGVVPTANITVSLGTFVTSRLLGNASVSNASEALLLIDEPGSGLTGAGPTAAQTLCSSPSAGAGAGGCIGQGNGLYFNAATGTAVTCTTVVTASNTCGTLGSGASPNVFQGLVSGNQVTFNGIPIIAPVSQGVTRVYRITNVRANANGIGSLGLAGTTPLNASIAISGSTSLPVNNPVLVAGFIQNGLSTSLRNGGNSGGISSTSGILASQQCVSINTGSSFGSGFSETLRFAENFGTAFKTRVAPTTAYNAVGLGAGSTSYTQNVPGSIYNSESGFIFPTLTGNGATAGLADFGTRLRAYFTNIPTGVNVFVTVTNFSGGNTGTFGNNTGSSGLTLLPANTTAIAELVQTETAGDFNGFPPFINPSNTFNNTAVYQVPLTPGANGQTGEAVWEVVSANPNATDTLDFGVIYQYSASPGTGSPALGTGKVNLSFAPAPGPPGTTPSTSYTSASGSLSIPRFVDNSTAANSIIINICSTDLLFPFVTNENGFETGISIANTSTDPFGTSPQNGSCYMQFYGDNAPATNTTTTAPCTSAGACTGAINSGKVFANTLSSIIGTGSFQGYMIAVCNFQFAHGFAFISDTHATNLAMGYLAMVMTNGSTVNRGTTAESLAH